MISMEALSGMINFVYGWFAIGSVVISVFCIKEFIQMIKDKG